MGGYRYIMFRIRVCEDVFTGCFLSNAWRGVEWEYWRYENDGFGDCSGEEVSKLFQIMGVY